jgi:hypothetical protein
VGESLLVPIGNVIDYDVELEREVSLWELQLGFMIVKLMRYM